MSCVAAHHAPAAARAGPQRAAPRPDQVIGEPGRHERTDQPGGAVAVDAEDAVSTKDVEQVRLADGEGDPGEDPDDARDAVREPGPEHHDTPPLIQSWSIMKHAPNETPLYGAFELHLEPGCGKNDHSELVAGFPRRCPP